MTIPLDASGFADEDDAHGTPRPKPGQYEFEVIQADDTFEKLDKVIIGLRVLAGTVPGQEGTEVTEFFGVASVHEDEKKTPEALEKIRAEKTKKMLERLMVFALAVKLIAPGEKKDVDFSVALGRRFIGGVEEQKGQDGKTYIKLGWDAMWSLDNPAVADVTRGEAADPEEKLTMAQLGGDEPVPSQPSPVAAGADEFSDL